MSRTPAPAPAGIRRRPKDRKATIARVAAEAFSTLGYHAVSVEAIATKVGVSAPALYRHFTSKYDLFRAAVLALSQELVDCTTDTSDTEDPAAVLDQVVGELIDFSLRNRVPGGLYRWQARYLQGEDASTLMEQLRLVNRRIQEPLAALRPSLTTSQLWMLSSGLLSVAGSIVDHGVRAPDGDVRALMAGAASTLLAAELPDPENVVAQPPVWHIFAADAGVYEALLHSAMMLFHQNGYAETGVAEIAAAAGIPASGIYRYFPGKSDILAVVMRRAADRLSGELSRVHGAQSEPREALTQLVEVYVATSFANPELASVYYSERVNLAAADQVLLRNVQRSTIDSWVRLLTAARSELTATQARFLVHAAMSLVVDLGRLVHYDRLTADSAGGPADASSYPQACVRTLMECVLFGG